MHLLFLFNLKAETAQSTTHTIKQTYLSAFILVRKMLLELLLFEFEIIATTIGLFPEEKRIAPR